MVALGREAVWQQIGRLLKGRLRAARGVKQPFNQVSQSTAFYPAFAALNPAFDRQLWETKVIPVGLLELDLGAKVSDEACAVHYLAAAHASISWRVGRVLRLWEMFGMQCPCPTHAGLHCPSQ